MIRRATPADAEALSSLSRTCFTQTFGHLYDPADLAAFLDEEYSPGVLRAELEDPHRATWLLIDDASEAAAQPDSSTAVHPTAPDPASEAPTSSDSQSFIGYVTACPTHLPHGRRGDPAPLHPGGPPGWRPRDFPAQHRASVARARRSAYPVDRSVERKLRRSAFLCPARFRGRRRILLHGGQSRRP